MFSAWAISDHLRQLRVSHSIRGLPAPRNMGYPQPKWVHVTDNIFDLQEGSVNFISASFAELSHTNIPRFPEFDQYPIDVALKMMLESTQPEVEVIYNVPTAMEYVAMVSKPSLLNNIQTLIYKIQPYSLRKETQAMILRFFTGQVSKPAMIFFLKKSFKTGDLIPLIEGSDDLRNAVIRSRSEPAEEVAAETGIAAFDLIYLGKERVVKAEVVKPKKAEKPALPPSAVIANAKANRKVTKF